MGRKWRICSAIQKKLYKIIKVQAVLAVRTVFLSFLQILVSRKLLYRLAVSAC